MGTAYVMEGTKGVGVFGHEQPAFEPCVAEWHKASVSTNDRIHTPFDRAVQQMFPLDNVCRATEPAAADILFQPLTNGEPFIPREDGRPAPWLCFKTATFSVTNNGEFLNTFVDADLNQAPMAKSSYYRAKSGI